MLDEKQAWYYEFVRKDIAPLLPDAAPEVLEVGCGGGGTLAWLKHSGVANRVSGIEINPEAAAIAQDRIDALFQGDADAQLDLLTPDSFDLILCLDVLEHLVDPWQTIQRIHRLLKPGGKLIVSLPNIRHYSVLLPLLLHGEFQYTEAGIMDRTHLRFFTRKTAMALLDDAGFGGLQTQSTYAWGTWDRFKDSLSIGLLKPFLSFQYLISAEKPLSQHMPIVNPS